MGLKRLLIDLLAAQNDPVTGAIKSGLRRGAATYYRLFKSGTFTFNEQDYEYFYRPTNKTWWNERCAEVPIVWSFVNNEDGDILEIGNVLPQYFDVSHDVVDKYDKSEHVIQEDVVDYSPGKQYDLIVSVSTLEHVGYNEEPENPEKVLDAFDNLESLLSPGGNMVVTLPMGQNPYVDKYLKNGDIEFDEMYHMKRISRDNNWKEVDWEEAWEAGQEDYFRSNKAFIVGVSHKPEGGG